MAQPKIYNWIAANAAAIALSQSNIIASYMVLNGTLSVSTNPVVVLPGMVRKVTLTSVGNMSGVLFTIVGTADGHAVNEVLAGPNNNTVTSVNNYESIISISSDTAYTAVSAGIGQTGTTSWYKHDYDRTVFNVGVQVAVAGTITYSFQVTLDDPNTVVAPTVFSPIVAMTAAVTPQLGNLTTPVAYSRVLVSASAGAATLTETICQQGLR